MTDKATSRRDGLSASPAWRAICEQLTRAGYQAFPSSLVERSDGTFVLFVDSVSDELRCILDGVGHAFLISAEEADWRSQRITVSPAEVARRSAETVELLTARLRSDVDPFWVLVRRLFRGQAIEIESAWLAHIWNEDVRMVTGTVVTGARDLRF